MRNRAEREERRRKYIGASDWPRLLGMFGGQMELFLDKQGKSTFEGNRATIAGSRLEDGILNEYEEATGDELERQFWVSNGCFSATLDAVVVGKPRAAEVKTSGILSHKADTTSDDGWGTPGTGDIPKAAWYQGMGQFLAAKEQRPLELIDFIALLNGIADPWEVYPVLPDWNAIGEIKEIGERFHLDHMLTGIPPSDMPLDVVEIQRVPQKSICLPDSLWADWKANQLWIDGLKERLAPTEKLQKALKEEILRMMEDAELAVFSGGTLRAVRRTRNNKPREATVDAWVELKELKEGGV